LSAIYSLLSDPSRSWRERIVLEINAIGERDVHARAILESLGHTISTPVKAASDDLQLEDCIHRILYNDLSALPAIEQLLRLFCGRLSSAAVADTGWRFFSSFLSARRQRIAANLLPVIAVLGSFLHDKSFLAHWTTELLS
jgi:hypothetical protein